MKIYFACSITGGREFEPVYQVMTRSLAADQHHVLTEHLVHSGALHKEASLEPIDVYTRDVNWIRESDVLIAEVSVPSHGVGYEIGYALAVGKPVLALHQKGRTVSKMISGNPDPNLCVLSYDDSEHAIAGMRHFLSGLFRS